MTKHAKIAFNFLPDFSRNNRRTCFRRCSKEDFKAVDTSIANISFEISEYEYL